MRYVEGIATRIRTIRGQRVLLGADLALLYAVPNKAFTQTVQRGTVSTGLRL